jgi:hypothetical protein
MLAGNAKLAAALRPKEGQADMTSQAGGHLTVHVGGCLCGAVRFEAQGFPQAVFHCHCASCRRHTGAAVASFAAFPVSSDRFRWTASAPASFTSSPGVTRRFCPLCGTPISYQAEKYPGEIHLNIGAFDRPDNFEPKAHYHVAERIAWFDTVDSFPRYPRDSSSGAGEEEKWGADEA